MLGVDRHQPAHWARDTVDTEWLRVSLRARSRQDQTTLRDVGVVDAAHRVLHGQLVAAVALLCYLAGRCIGQHAQAVTVKRPLFGRIQDRPHSVHHLGMTLTPVMLPVQLTAVSPASSAGNSGAEMVALRLTPPAP